MLPEHIFSPKPGSEEVPRGTPKSTFKTPDWCTNEIFSPRAATIIDSRQGSTQNDLNWTLNSDLLDLGAKSHELGPIHEERRLTRHPGTPHLQKDFTGGHSPKGPTHQSICKYRHLDIISIRGHMWTYFDFYCHKCRNLPKFVNLWPRMESCQNVGTWKLTDALGTRGCVPLKSCLTS